MTVVECDDLRIATTGEVDLESLLKHHARNTSILAEHASRRWRDLLGVVLVLGAFGFVLFAPAHRETLSWIAWAGLIVVAAGLFGYRRVYLKVQQGELRVDGGEDGSTPQGPPVRPNAPKLKGARKKKKRLR